MYQTKHFVHSRTDVCPSVRRYDALIPCNPRSFINLESLVLETSASGDFAIDDNHTVIKSRWVADVFHGSDAYCVSYKYAAIIRIVTIR